jgi:hypothetical protein
VLRVSRFSEQHESPKRIEYSRLWRRPSRVAAIVVGLSAAVVGAVLQEHGFGWKYSDVGITTVLLVWFLLAGFRPAWHRVRYWLLLCAIVAAHVVGWVRLTSSIEHIGFPLMFGIVIVEVFVAATLIMRAIPEDEKVMGDYINRW